MTFSGASQAEGNTGDERDRFVRVTFERDGAMPDAAALAGAVTHPMRAHGRAVGRETRCDVHS